MHITATCFINDDEAGLHQDYEDWLEKLAPHKPISQYRHNRTVEDNGDAHLKRQITGREVVVAISGGKLDFGPWEQICYGESDGRAAGSVCSSRSLESETHGDATARTSVVGETPNSESSLLWR